MPTNFYGCCLRLASIWRQDINPKTVETISWPDLVTKYFGYAGMLLELKHDTALERSPFFGLQGNQFPSQCDISCIIALEKAFSGAKSAANQFAPVFAGFMHLAWLSMVWYVDERKSGNNLEGSSFLAIDSRFLVKCNRRTVKSTVLGG